MDVSKLNDVALELAAEALKLATKKIEEQRARIEQLERHVADLLFKLHGKEEE